MRTIYVPPGEKGDEIVKRLIPTLHKIAKGKQRKHRNNDD